MLPDRLSKGEEVRLHIVNAYAKNMLVLNGVQLMWFRLIISVHLPDRLFMYRYVSVI